ncbi:restriction endonuclease subunit S [Bacteroides zhangwenhongii]|uniref:restriction endonuclease subunit S n=1 Tax=Bacteroides zhangwenhongii TaxID=2650157 RepID=UPI0022E28095|nr:restriction endonuclease subunit S [Bacteroides zhangwenhongii]
MANNNNTKNLNVPNLRFPEFKGEWEKSLLGQIADITKGSGISKEQLSNQGTPCILYGELYTKYKSEIINEVYSKTTLNPSSLVKSQANDVIIPCSGETAIDISTARCVPYNNILLGGDLNIIQLKSQDGGFFAYQLNGVRKYDIARIAQGVSVVHLYGENLKRIKVCYPTVEEQRKITSLLSLIDERISTQNKIIEKYESLIKGLNEKLLINKKEYTTYQLSDICEIRSGYSGAQLTGTQGLMVSRIETISKHCINLDKVGYVKPFNSSADFKLHIGDILFSNINSVQYIGNTAFVDREYNLYHGMNLLRLIPHKTVEPFYIFLLLNTITYKSYFQSICNKAISQASINQTELGKTVIHIPDLSYQKQICLVYNSLYNKKSLENLYLQVLKQQKSYLLRQMFI